jgi:hypothetical protein
MLGLYVVLLWVLNFCSSVADNSVLLGYDTVSLANQILTFQSKSVLTSKSQNGHFNPLKCGLYIASKHHTPITHLHNSIFQENGILNVSRFTLCDTLMKTSHYSQDIHNFLTALCCYIMPIKRIFFPVFN